MWENAKMRLFTAAALMSGAMFVGGAHAQSSIDTAWVSLTPVQQYVAAAAIPTQLALPSNVVVPPMFRPVVEAMLRGSATFRRQCVRLAGESAVTVVLVIGPQARRSDRRAATRMMRSDVGHLTAYVEIPPFQDLQELIAHELEHIIEQLDGIDLAAQAALAHTGVRQIGARSDMFETERATRMGLKVASELRQ